MPETKKNTRRKYRLPCRLHDDYFVHELEEPLRVVLHFHVDIEFDMLVFRLPKRQQSVLPQYTMSAGLGAHQHQQRNRLGKRWDRLLGLLHGAYVFHPILAIPITLLDVS